MDNAEKMAADIAVKLNGGEWSDGKWYSEGHRKAWIDAVKPYAEKIERLQETIEHWKRLEREAATYVESVICMKSRHFTGEEPYVGWKGLGLALKQDYEDMDRMREALRNVPQTIAVASDQIERLREAFQNYIEHVGCGTAIRCEHCDAARAVLQQKESE